MKEKNMEEFKKLYKYFGDFNDFLDYLTEYPNVVETYSKKLKDEITEKFKERIRDGNCSLHMLNNYYVYEFEQMTAIAKRIKPKEQREFYGLRLEDLLKKINEGPFEEHDIVFESNCREAGEIAEKIGNLELAIKMYEQNEQYCDAARCLEKNKDYNKALKYYLKGEIMWGDGSLEGGLSLAKKLGNEPLMLEFYKKLIKEWDRLEELQDDDGDICYGHEDPIRALKYYKEAGTSAAKLKKEKTAIKFYLEGLNLADCYSGKFAHNKFKKIFVEAKSQDLMKQLVESIKKKFKKDTAEDMLKIANKLK